MRSIFWKIFLSFWLAMVLITVVAVLSSFQLARSYSNFVDEIDRRELMHEAGSALEEHGVDGFRAWLQSDAQLPDDITIYLIDTNGVDALGRRISPQIKRQWTNYKKRLERRNRRDGPSGNRRQNSRGQIEFTAPGGLTYRPMLGPVPPRVFGVLGIPRIALLVLTIGMLISAAVCYMLSRYLTRPITRIAGTAELLAAGKLQSRVGTSAYRADEIGVLAKQFDRMAGELERSESSRRDLFRNISHELRSPLARIHVALELAARAPDDVPRHLQRIGLEAQHMERLIAQVLELVRIQQESVQSASAVNLTEILSNVVDDARFEGEAQRKRVEFTCDSEEALVSGCPEVLSSAIENVLRNAIAHTPENSTVQVTLEKVNEDICVCVCDQGQGVPEHELDRLFEPFYRQSDNTLKGAGVGLAITAQSMTLLGGTVVARNAESGGLCVELTLPAMSVGKSS